MHGRQPETLDPFDARDLEPQTLAPVQYLEQLSEGCATADWILAQPKPDIERPETLTAGVPIVSVSLGDTARFVVGGLARREPTRPVLLRSGDVLVMGGPSRLRFHGVTRIVPGTAPAGLGPGRFNLTLRQW